MRSLTVFVLLATAISAQQYTVLVLDANGNPVANAYGCKIDSNGLHCDNASRGKITLSEGGTSSVLPGAGQQALQFDPVTHHLQRINSAGVVVDIETGITTGGGGTGQTVSIWPATTVPPNSIVAGSGLELGLKFKSDSAGSIYGVRFYKDVRNTGTHVGNLWSATGTLLGSVTFSGETASGWQQANFAIPISIQAGLIYVVSYHTSTAYSYALNVLNTAGVDAPPLHAIAANVSPNGVYQYGTVSTFPTTSSAAANYFVDVMFK